MNLQLPACAAAALLGLHSLTPRPAEPSAQQPPLRLTLELDGQRYDALDGQELAVTIGGREVRARVDVGAARRFQAAGVRFDYPLQMVFEFDDSDGIPLWSLDGADCTLLVTEVESQDVDEVLRAQLEGMTEAMGAEDVASRPWTSDAGGVERAGLQARFAMAALGLEVELKGFGVAVGDRVVTLVLQDFPDDGEHEEEAGEILALLRATFALTGGR